MVEGELEQGGGVGIKGLVVRENLTEMSRLNECENPNQSLLFFLSFRLNEYWNTKDFDFCTTNHGHCIGHKMSRRLAVHRKGELSVITMALYKSNDSLCLYALAMSNERLRSNSCMQQATHETMRTKIFLQRPNHDVKYQNYPFFL
ncbi:hypothetical protein JHK87_000621 [Glycine soja]|nr:hypothetical protein JHK87_000621 [Glycine soja]